MTTEDDKDVERFVADKKEIRKVLSAKLVEMQKQWEKLPPERMDQMDIALSSVLADLTAEVMVGTHDISEESFMQCMSGSYEMARRKRDAIDSGAYV